MLSKFLLNLYKIKNHRVRTIIRSIVYRLEGGEFYSETIRKIYSTYYGVDIGKYSHGGCFDIYMIDPYTKIGRYCSLAKGVRIVNHNHPVSFKSTSALFFNPELGYSDKWLVDFNPIEIGNDVWIGANAVILPEVKQIGDGAIIGAGSVVFKDVPPYAVVLGNPGRVIKYRFSEEMIKNLIEEKWWERDIEDIKSDIVEYQTILEMDK